MKICFIHGASSSKHSFAYIETHLNLLENEKIYLEYDSDNGFFNNLEVMKQALSETREDIFFITHSLGGIYALHLTKHFDDRIIGCISMSTPYGGAETGDWLKWLFPAHKLFKDIGLFSDPITQSRDIDISQKNWTQIVTTTGHQPHIPFQNDGVVTISSMNSRNDMDKISIEANHYEIVLHKDAAKIVKDKLYEIYRSRR